MAATVEIDEANGVGETLTHNITNTNMGSTDAVNLDPVTNPLTLEITPLRSGKKSM